MNSDDEGRRFCELETAAGGLRLAEVVAGDPQSIRITVSAPELTAAALVGPVGYGGVSVDAYFRDLAIHWPGKGDHRTWCDADEWLTLEAEGDGRSTVTIRVRLMAQADPTWNLEAEVRIDYGQLERNASLLEQLFGSTT